MGALTAADVTVVVTDHQIIGMKRHATGTITFGDGSLTYPTAGIPLPAIDQFSFARQMDVLRVFGVNELTSDYVVGYNKPAHKLQLFEEEGTAAGGPLLECDTSEAPEARTYYFEAWGW